MRGVHSAVDDIRRNVFTEVARLAYGEDDYNKVDMIPYKLIPGEVAHHRHDVFLERAIISARLKLALGMDLNPNGPSAPISAEIQKAATDQKYFNEPLVNIIPYACNACPPKQIRITDSCQGCISHPCMNVCPRDAIYLDEHKHCHIDQDKCIKCGRCFNQCPYRAISKIERPCAAACGMDAIESDELGRAKINYDKCVSCGMCLVNCPFAAIADKSQIFQVIQAIKRKEEVIACVAPAFVGQYGKEATPAKLKTAMRTLGFADVVEVAIGADLCTVEEANDFLREVPEKIDWMKTTPSFCASGYWTGSWAGFTTIWMRAAPCWQIPWGPGGMTAPWRPWFWRPMKSSRATPIRRRGWSGTGLSGSTAAGTSTTRPTPPSC